MGALFKETPAGRITAGPWYQRGVAAITKLGIGLALVATGWVAGLYGMGFVADGWVIDDVEDRLEDSFLADATVASAEVGLVRGRIGLDRVQLIREDGGHLRMRIDRVDAGIAPAGLALVDRDLRQVRIRGVELEVSAWGALAVPAGQREPISMDSLTLENARFTFVPTELAGGWGRFELVIDRARSRATTLRTPVSWVFTVDELTAHVDLPAGMTIHLRYAGGRLSASGALLGSKPIEIPVSIPVPVEGKEVEQLLTLGQEIARRLTVERAGSWFEREVLDRILK